MRPNKPQSNKELKLPQFAIHNRKCERCGTIFNASAEDRDNQVFACRPCRKRKIAVEELNPLQGHSADTPEGVLRHHRRGVMN